jgi:hypothetical protein
MTLQKAGDHDQISERSIQVMSRAVRWGNDGVGLQFVLPENQEPRNGKSAQMDGAGRKELARFLKALLKGKEEAPVSWHAPVHAGQAIAGAVDAENRCNDAGRDKR